ncbi:MAG: hypothetical protein MUE33_00135 [Cytophagaceae bacterium]|jgi:hypothetical protein|nr:hypothetical protein [Cytophagaceae bacterium]
MTVSNHNHLRFLFFLLLLGVLYSCKKEDETTGSTPFVPDKTLPLTINLVETVKDTGYVLRSATQYGMRLSALTNASAPFHRLYIFKKEQYGTTSTTFETYPYAGFVKDNAENWYKDISIQGDTNEVVDIIHSLSTRTDQYSEDFYIVFTSGDYSAPGSTTNLVIGPIEFSIQYGLLTEYTAKRVYNYQGTQTPILNLYNVTTYTASTADSNRYIMDMDSVTTAFERLFVSKNGTRFVRVPVGFNYTRATDTRVRDTYENLSSSSFTEATTPVQVGDVYIAKLKGVSTTRLQDYVLLRCTAYFDNLQTGTNRNNDFIQWSVKK